MADNKILSKADAMKEQKCQACGGSLAFDPATGKLVCEYCGTVQDIQPEEPAEQGAAAGAAGAAAGAEIASYSERSSALPFSTSTS